jgi:hypothetical protein
MTLVVPIEASIRLRLYRLRKNSIQGGFVTVRHRCFRPAMDETRLRCSAFAEGAGAFRPLKSRPGWGGLQARTSFFSSRVLLNLHSCFLLGHGFSRADKANQMSWALAPAKAHSCSSLAFGSFSAACLAAAKLNSSKTEVAGAKARNPWCCIYCLTGRCGRMPRK